MALTAVGISFGGSMTYAQSIGLTHNPALVGNWPALRWGMLGPGPQGGIWFGFAGLFLGMGLGGKRWRPREMVALLLGMMGLLALGTWALNRPFDPTNHVLPRLYFSADWYWQPGADLKPRPEDWGGLLIALLGATAYVGRARRDGLAWRMAGVGFLAGALGFPIGQCIQAFHAWNPGLFGSGTLQAIDPYINWWNMMETTFGAIGGGGLAWGLWENRQRIAVGEDDEISISPRWEVAMVAAHLVLLIGAEFNLVPALGPFVEYSPALAILALPGIVGGRFWAYLFALPIVALPIAIKTLYSGPDGGAPFDRPSGWVLLVALPSP